MQKTHTGKSGSSHQQNINGHHHEKTQQGGKNGNQESQWYNHK